MGNPYRGRGNDVSWPQCERDVINNLPKSNFAILGVTGGSAFTKNPCLAEEYKWAITTGSVSLYMNLNLFTEEDIDKGLKGPYGNCKTTDNLCIGANYGYNGAKEAMGYAKEIGISEEKMWWLDIEEINTWSEDINVNRKIIDGAVSYFKEKGIPVGIYSTPIMWRDLTGNYQINLPAWPAIISEAPYENCGQGFTGGKTFIVQHNQDELDKNFACL